MEQLTKVEPVRTKLRDDALSYTMDTFYQEHTIKEVKDDIRCGDFPAMTAQYLTNLMDEAVALHPREFNAEWNKAFVAYQNAIKELYRLAGGDWIDELKQDPLRPNYIERRPTDFRLVSGYVEVIPTLKLLASLTPVLQSEADAICLAGFRQYRMMQRNLVQGLYDMFDEEDFDFDEDDEL